MDTEPTKQVLNLCSKFFNTRIQQIKILRLDLQQFANNPAAREALCLLNNEIADLLVIQKGLNLSLGIQDTNVISLLERSKLNVNPSSIT